MSRIYTHLAGQAQLWTNPILGHITHVGEERPIRVNFGVGKLRRITSACSGKLAWHSAHAGETIAVTPGFNATMTGQLRPRPPLTRRDILRLVAGSALLLPAAKSLALCNLEVPPQDSCSAAKALTAKLQSFVDSRQIAGGVGLVSRAGRTTYLQAVGEQDIEKHLPMRTDTVFDMRSMTKQVTAVALMCLVEDGKVRLDEPIATYLPEFSGVRVADPKTKELRAPSRPITCIHLLTHTSGMSEERPAEITNITRVLDRTLADVVRIIAKQPLLADPGAPWAYSSPGYAVLGRIIEVRSGKPYEQFVAERILRPLAMRDSFFFPPRDKWPRIAAMYNLESGTLRRDVIDIYRQGAKYPAPEFGMFSTAGDTDRFFRMMLNGGILDGKSILWRKTVDNMLQARVPTSLDGVSQGLAWFICTDPQKQSALRISKGSFGAAGASGTFGWINPDEQLIRLLLMQRFGGSDAERNAFMALAADVH